MKMIYKQLNTVLFAFFIVGMLAVAFLLFNLPNDLERASLSIDAQALKDAQPVLWKLYLVTGITLITGIGTLFITIFRNNADGVKERIVYRDRVADDDVSLDESGEDQKEDVGMAIKQISDRMVGETNIKKKADQWLAGVCNAIEASQAVLYIVSGKQRKKSVELFSSFAFNINENERITYELGEGLVGQVAKSGKKLYVDDVPDDYIKIISGLGSGSPTNLLLVPFSEGKDVVAVVEIASFKEIDEDHQTWIEEAYRLLGKDLVKFLRGAEGDRKKPKKESNSNQ
jgi:methyl-accepting chemotaxis protein